MEVGHDGCKRRLRGGRLLLLLAIQRGHSQVLGRRSSAHRGSFDVLALLRAQEFAIAAELLAAGVAIAADGIDTRPAVPRVGRNVLALAYALA